LFTNVPVVLTKPGKIKFEDAYVNATYKDPRNKLSHIRQYKREKKAYDDTIDKETTTAYNPYFVYESTDNSTGKINGQVGTLSKTVSGKYFTIIDILAKKYGEKQYSKLKSLSDLDWRASLNVILKNDETKDTLYWQIDQARNIVNCPFMLVPYFTKQKQLYLNKKLVATKNFNNVIDINTGQIVNIKQGDIYTCNDISFVDSEKSKYFTPMYFLKNEKGYEVSFVFGSLEDGEFITEKEFLRRAVESKKLEDQRKKELLAEQKRQAQEMLAFKNECVKLFGTKMGALVSQGNVVLGMTKDMCLYAWGNPIDTNTMRSAGGVTEQWVYNWSTYLYFQNGILKTIQN
jgi:hypothetical protein